MYLFPFNTGRVCPETDSPVLECSCMTSVGAEECVCLRKAHVYLMAMAQASSWLISFLAHLHNSSPAEIGSGQYYCSWSRLLRGEVGKGQPDLGAVFMRSIFKNTTNCLGSRKRLHSRGVLSSFLGESSWFWEGFVLFCFFF